MLTWFLSNLGTILVLLIMASIISAVIFKLVKDKKKGVHSCGCNCASCPMHCQNSQANNH